MYEFYESLSQVSVVLISLSIILFAGFLVTRVTKFFNLPNVSGFIIAGILIGPYVGKMIPPEIISGMEFVSDIALAFIAFSVGRFFRLSVLKKTGRKVVIITVFESLTAGILISLMLRFVFQTSWAFALVAGAIATATAPASTIMTIRQYHAKGEFVDILLQVVAMDDVVALLAFSVASSMAHAALDGTVSLNDVLTPVFSNGLGILMGLGCGAFLKKLLEPGRSKDNRLILPVATLLGLAGLCSALDISPLLACMAFGGAFINLTSDKKLFNQIDRFTPPILSCFFILSGMRLNVTALKTAGVIGVAYFLVRIVGKYAGAWLGCHICGTDAKIRNYLGVALIPQAGVSIGLAVLGQRILPAGMGNLLSTIILSSSVLYELVGPASARTALFLSGAIHEGKEETAAVSHSDISNKKEEKTKEEKKEEKSSEVPSGKKGKKAASVKKVNEKEKKKAGKARKHQNIGQENVVMAWKVAGGGFQDAHLNVVPRMVHRQNMMEHQVELRKINLNGYSKRKKA